jgi:hypothetical protein
MKTKIQAEAGKARPHIERLYHMLRASGRPDYEWMGQLLFGVYCDLGILEMDPDRILGMEISPSCKKS